MDSQKQVDLGSWIGLPQAFGIVSGSCSAARAQCLRQVRDSKMLDDLGFTWDEFCRDYAGVSRQHADHLIQQHAEFGDAYFRLSEIARVFPAPTGKSAPTWMAKLSRSMARNSCSPRPMSTVPALPPRAPGLPPV